MVIRLCWKPYVRCGQTASLSGNVQCRSLALLSTPCRRPDRPVQRIVMWQRLSQRSSTVLQMTTIRVFGPLRS